MEAKAIAKYVRMSPSKLKPVVDLVRGKDLQEALTILKFTPGKGAELVEKVVQSAAANAENNFQMNPDELYVAEVAHALSKHVRGNLLPASEASMRLVRANSLVDELVSISGLVNEVFSESLRLGHSSYDVFYFVLARRNAATLCTLDRRLQQLCLENGVNCVSGLDAGDERWTVRAETEVGPSGMGGVTREELERAVGRGANGV